MLTHDADALARLKVVPEVPAWRGTMLTQLIQPEFSLSTLHPCLHGIT